MSHKKHKPDPDEPKPLNFDDADKRGPDDRLKKPYMTPKDARGDDQNEQYYDEEEALSPEEAKQRKKEGTI